VTVAGVARLAIIAAGLLSVSLLARSQAPSFRATTDTVLVPVLVTDATGPVRGLSATDFELLDNAVPQVVSVSAIESRPIDVTLVLDASASVSGRPMAQFTSYVNRIATSLQPTDRWRLFTFGSRLVQVLSEQPGGTAPTFSLTDVGGTTAFYDALLAALISASSGDRPQLVFAFTDGADNMSFNGPDRVMALAARSGATLYVRLTQPRGLAPSLLLPYLPRPDLRALRDLTDRTGGAVSTVDPGDALPKAFVDVLGNFRMRYLLTYTPTNADAAGWHDIVVRTKKAGQSVRARNGYERQ